MECLGCRIANGIEEGDGFAWSEPLHPHGAENFLSQTQAKILSVLKRQ